MRDAISRVRGKPCGFEATKNPGDLFRAVAELVGGEASASGAAGAVQRTLASRNPDSPAPIFQIKWF